MKIPSEEPNIGDSEHKPRWGATILAWLAAGLIITNILLLIFQTRQPPESTVTPTGSLSANVGLTVVASSTPSPATLTPTPQVAVTLQPTAEVPVSTQAVDLFPSNSLADGTIILSVVQNGYSNLAVFKGGGDAVIFAPHPWDDIDPALSMDGRLLAFSSKRNGYWNIYTLDMSSNTVTAITDSPAYDGHPAWSPDGRYLIFETYDQGHFRLQLADLTTGVVKTSWLTPAEENSYDATWSPSGDRIVYVKETGGTSQLAFLKVADGVITPAEELIDGGAQPSSPAFSPDGQELAWSATNEGRRWLFTQDLGHPDIPASALGLGDDPVWGPDGSSLLTALQESNSSYLTAYNLLNGSLLLPPLPVTGSIHGISWGSFSADLPLDTAQSVAALPAPYSVVLTPVVQTGRANLSPITGVSLEYPYLHDAVDESFTALRQRVSAETGWDVFSSLQAAFLPVSQPPEAASEWDWLYTGRAILLNRLPQEVGWMAVAREDFGEQTYWRIFLRPLTQDGSQGSPQHARAWDLYARFHTNPGAYEHGGELSTSALDGYWVDLTEIANRYGWQRLSALPEWINYLPASRFGILVNAPGLSWTKAMLELYPSAVFPHTAPQKVDPGISTPVKTLPGPQPTLHPTWTPAP